MRGRIDMDLVNRLLDEGRLQQKEIAAAVGCSPANICKILKRREQAASMLPESVKSLSPKRQKFVMAIAEGKSRTAAALEAFDAGSVSNAKSLGKVTARDPDVATAIHDLMHQCGIGRMYRTRRLATVINAGDLGIAVKGLDMANRMTGEYVAPSIDINVHYDPRGLSAMINETRKMLEDLRSGNIEDAEIIENTTEKEDTEDE